MMNGMLPRQRPSRRPEWLKWETAKFRDRAKSATVRFPTTSTSERGGKWRRGLSLARGLALAASLFVGPMAGTASGFEQIVVFGDSLSDSGNAGRFSNGPVWVEYLAERLGLVLQPSRAGGSNYAVGGARLDPQSGSDSWRAQADAYFRRGRAPSGTLYIVYGGANDVLAAVGNPRANLRIDAAVTSLRNILTELTAAQAADVLVPNLPDVSITPAIQSRGRASIEEATELTTRFNRQLEQILAQMQGIRLRRLDVAQLADRVREDPSALGFTNVTTPYNQLSGCEGYLFWDNVHPTTRAHERLAGAAFRNIASP